MKLILIYFLFSIGISTSYANPSSSWYLDIKTAIKQGDSIECNYQNSIEITVTNLPCIEALIVLENTIYKEWGSTDIELRKSSLVELYESSKKFGGIVTSPSIKLSIIDLLSQLNWNGSDINELQEMRSYVKTFVFSNNPLEKDKALTALGFIGTAEDTTMLIELLEHSTDVAHKRKLIGAIITMAKYQCIDLSRVYDVIHDQSTIDYLDEYLAKSHGFLKCH